MKLLHRQGILGGARNRTTGTSSKEMTKAACQQWRPDLRQHDVPHCAQGCGAQAQRRLFQIAVETVNPSRYRRQHVGRGPHSPELATRRLRQKAATISGELCVYYIVFCVQTTIS